MQREASEQELKSAYRKLAMANHPDRNPGDHAAEERFKEANEAYAVLSDGEKRSRYNQFGHAGVNGGGSGFEGGGFQDISDIFGDIFGFNDLFGQQGGGRRTRAQKGPDLREDLQLDFEAAVFGKTTEVNIRRHENCEGCRGSGVAAGKAPVTCRTCGGRGQVRYQQGFFSIARTCSGCNGAGQVIQDPCTKCRGEGKVVKQRKVTVEVPAGVEDGNRIRFAGMGEAGAQGGPSGDLYVVLHVKEHAFFAREGTTLHCVIPISFAQAALGTELSVPTLEGDHDLRVPEGTQTGARFKLKNMGVPELNGRGRGDLFVEVKVQTPKKLTARQRELMQEFQSHTPMANEPVSRTLFDKVKDMFN